MNTFLDSPQARKAIDSFTNDINQMVERIALEAVEAAKASLSKDAIAAVMASFSTKTGVADSVPVVSATPSRVRIRGRKPKARVAKAAAKADEVSPKKAGLQAKILKTLKATKGNASKAAKILGLNRSTVSKYRDLAA